MGWSRYKTPHHPHTNMAKAALNMMTRTSAEALSKRRIFMNAVDTGWINDENPLQKAAEVAPLHHFRILMAFLPLPSPTLHMSGHNNSQGD